MQLFRVSGVLDLGRVQESKLIVIGLGSLGSLVTANLAYPWREIVLIDPEPLEEDNVERHLLGYSSVGLLKVKGMRDWLVDRGVDPSKIVIDTRRAPVALEEHEDADLLIVAIDSITGLLNVNAWAYEYGIPAIYGGVYPKGSGGDVFVIPNPREICYQCAAQMMGRDQQERKGPRTNYDVTLEEVLADDGSPKAVPALRQPIAAIANEIAGFALELLSGESIDAQVLVRGNTWEHVVNLSTTESLMAVANFIAFNSKDGILSNLKLENGEGGLKKLLIRRSNLALKLSTHSKCTLHGNSRSMSSEEI